MIDLQKASLLELAVMYAQNEGPPIATLEALDAEIARRGQDDEFNDIYNRLEDGDGS
jgi:hypothetical protein